MEIKDLKEEFEGTGEVKGFKFIQKAKNDAAYLYEVYIPDVVEPHYEVFEKRINTQFNCVSYPKANAFGAWAWCYFDYNRAVEKFMELSEKVSFKVGCDEVLE